MTQGARVVGPVRLPIGTLCAILSFAISPTAALAEVCDKVAPHWSGGEPMTPFTFFLWSFGNPFIILWFAAVCALTALGGRAARIIAAGLCLLMATASFIDELEPGPFRDAALREGCVADPWVFTSFWTLLGVAIIVRVLRPAPRRTV